MYSFLDRGMRPLTSHFTYRLWRRFHGGFRQERVEAERDPDERVSVPSQWHALRRAESAPPLLEALLLLAVVLAATGCCQLAVTELE